MKLYTFICLFATILLIGCGDSGSKTKPLNDPTEQAPAPQEQVAKTPLELIIAAETAVNDADIITANSLIESYLEQVTTNEAYKVVETKWAGDAEIRNRVFSRILAEHLAAKTGDSRAIYRAGLAYYTGKGAVKNFDKAMTYFTNETQADNPGVMYYMADMLLDESYAGYDLTKGTRLLKSSADAGYAAAVKRLQ